MPADFTLKAHDRLPSIQATLSSNLTTATGVEFIMKEAGVGGTVKVNAAATIVDAAAGIVRYDWLSADSDTPGEYLAEWEVTFTGGKKQTFPTLTFHTIDVLADLDGA